MAKWPAHVLENKKDIFATIFIEILKLTINAKRFSRQQTSFDAGITHILFV